MIWVWFEEKCIDVGVSIIALNVGDDANLVAVQRSGPHASAFLISASYLRAPNSNDLYHILRVKDILLLAL